MSISTLPYELKYQILMQIPDMFTLKSLLTAILSFLSVFSRNESTIRSEIIFREITTSYETEAYATAIFSKTLGSYVWPLSIDENKLSLQECDEAYRFLIKSQKTLIQYMIKTKESSSNISSFCEELGFEKATLKENIIRHHESIDRLARIFLNYKIRSMGQPTLESPLRIQQATRPFCHPHASKMPITQLELHQTKQAIYHLWLSVLFAEPATLRQIYLNRYNGYHPVNTMFHYSFWQTESMRSVMNILAITLPNLFISRYAPWMNSITNIEFNYDIRKNVTVPSFKDRATFGEYLFTSQFPETASRILDFEEDPEGAKTAFNSIFKVDEMKIGEVMEDLNIFVERTSTEGGVWIFLDKRCNLRNFADLSSPLDAIRVADVRDILVAADGRRVVHKDPVTGRGTMWKPFPDVEVMTKLSPKWSAEKEGVRLDLCMFDDRRLEGWGLVKPELPREEDVEEWGW